MSGTQAPRPVDAAAVYEGLVDSPIGELPSNEAQTRPLAPLNEEQRVEA